MSLLKYILKEELLPKNLQETNTCLPEGSFADALRKDLIEKYLEDIEDEDIREEYSEDPDYDLLLEPDHWDGYEYQNYIQYISQNEFWVYEGFSSYCWEGFKKQKQYKKLSKEQIIESFIKNRAPKLGEEFAFTLYDSDYFIHESYYYQDYIMILKFKRK